VLEPGAVEAPLVGLRLTRRNSSVSAKTRFICYQLGVSQSSDVGIEPMDCETYFIESEHLTGHLPAVVEGYSHAIVDLRIL